MKRWDAKEMFQASEMCFGTGNISFVYVTREWFSCVQTQLCEMATFSIYKNVVLRVITKKNNWKMYSYGIFLGYPWSLASPYVSIGVLPLPCWRDVTNVPWTLLITVAESFFLKKKEYLQEKIQLEVNSIRIFT